MKKHYATEFIGEDRPSPIPVYLASEADARIAELEKALREIQSHCEGRLAAGFRDINRIANRVL